MLYRAKNGCNGEVSLKRIPVYFEWDTGVEHAVLGKRLEKDVWIEDNITDDPSAKQDVTTLLVDWELHENGWFVNSHENIHLLHYLTQIVYEKPSALQYIR